jgi:hypothetical protein
LRIVQLVSSKGNTIIAVVNEAVFRCKFVNRAASRHNTDNLELFHGNRWADFPALNQGFDRFLGERLCSTIP